MEEELHYCSVDFQNANVSKPKEKKGKKEEEETIYADVKAKGRTSDQSHASAVDEKPAPDSQQFRLLAVCLGMLCAVLLSAIIGLCVYFSTVITKDNTRLENELKQLAEDHTSLLVANHVLQNNYSDLSSENQQLKAENSNLTQEKDGLNWTLGVIFQYDYFPVDFYCPRKDANTHERVCKPCLDGWELFQSSCYLFWHFDKSWKTWEKSREYCREKEADLVVIGSQEEQEFINDRTEFYYDKFHGYWIGLSEPGGKSRWLWVDGSNLTGQYWMTQPFGTNGNFALFIHNSTGLYTWDTAHGNMKNRYICENKALILSN